MTSNTSQQIAGSLRIWVQLDSRRVRQVCIESSRPLAAAQVLRGRTPEEAVQLVPLLFSLCGKAQSVAAATACEQALGHPTEPAESARRHFSLNLERVREHALRLLLEWPLMLGLQADQTGAAQILRLHRSLQAAGGTSPPAETAAACQALIKRVRECILGDQWRPTEPVPWVPGPEGTSDTAMVPRLFQTLERRGWSRLGADAEFTPLEALPVEDWRQILADADTGFSARPEVAAQPRENTPYARLSTTRTLQRSRARWGCGLASRLAALAIELDIALQRLETGGDGPAEEEWVRSGRGPDGEGFAVVEAARGRLIHQVSLRDGRIDHYLVSAPTEWNFHPRGAAAEALKRLPFASTEDYRARARALIGALDPCVGYELEVADHA